MFKDVKKLEKVLKDILRDRTDEQFIDVVAYAIDDVLSLNDFRLLTERLEEDVFHDVE